MKEEKTMIDINKVIKLRNITLTAIEIEKENRGKFGKGTPSQAYRLGMLHCLVDYKDKLNELIIQG